LLADVHDRMPVILPAELYDRWLDPGMHGLEGLLGLLKPYDPALMRRYPVSQRVNLVTNDGPECSAPVDLPATTGSLFG
jgi:putative SOS response-associated peptidase YedK